MRRFESARRLRFRREVETSKARTPRTAGLLASTVVAPGKRDANVSFCDGGDFSTRAAPTCKPIANVAPATAPHDTSQAVTRIDMCTQRIRPSTRTQGHLALDLL